MDQQPDQRHPMFPVFLLGSIFLCIIWVILIIKNDRKENKQIKYLLVGGGENTCDILNQIQQFLTENMTATLEDVCIKFKIQIENFAKKIINCYGIYNDQEPILAQLLDILKNTFHIEITNEFYNLVKKLLKDPLSQVDKHMKNFVQNTLQTKRASKKYLKYKTKYLELKKLLE